MSSFKSQPDVRVRNCSWSFFPSFLMHSHPEAAVSGQASESTPTESFTIMSIGMRREERRMDLLGFQALI